LIQNEKNTLRTALVLTVSSSHFIYYILSFLKNKTLTCIIADGVGGALREQLAVLDGDTNDKGD